MTNYKRTHKTVNISVPTTKKSEEIHEMVAANDNKSLHMEFKTENLERLVNYVASELAPEDGA